MTGMRAAVLYGKKDIRIEEVEKPSAGPGEVVVQIKAVGICGSDVHYYEEFRMGKTYEMVEPQILGHLDKICNFAPGSSLVPARSVLETTTTFFASCMVTNCSLPSMEST